MYYMRAREERKSPGHCGSGFMLLRGRDVYRFITLKVRLPSFTT